MANEEERRIAASELISNATLAVLGAMGAVTVVGLDSRSPTWLYWLLTGLATISFVASIIQGGKGIASAHDPKGAFNLQAVFCFLGFIVFLVSIPSLGPSASDNFLQALVDTNKDLARFEERLVRYELRMASDSARLHDMQTQLDGLRLVRSKSATTRH